ncbi:hypothetical protein THAOC_04432, partial [Thalassiosira oceanica]
MPSRKKARGRQNRAKKEAIRIADLRSLWEPMALCSRSNLDAAPCENLLAAPPQIPQELEGPVVSFMNHMAGEGFFNKATQFPFETVMMTCWRFATDQSLLFPGVKEEDNEQRALVIDLLLRFLRNSFVRDSAIEGENWYLYQHHDNEMAICNMINVLEIRGKYSDLNVIVLRSAKMGDKLVYGNRRDILKFVAKRLPCTCLKELHRAARKKVEKVGSGMTKVLRWYDSTSCVSLVFLPPHSSSASFAGASSPTNPEEIAQTAPSCNLTADLPDLDFPRRCRHAARAEGGRGVPPPSSPGRRRRRAGARRGSCRRPATSRRGSARG